MSWKRSLTAFLLLLFVSRGKSQESGDGPTDPEPTEPPPPPCDGEFYEPTGTIQSPEYPSNYPNKQNCVYRVLTDNIIHIRFSLFDLENSEECRYDFLKLVFEATSNEPNVQKYCGRGLAKVNDGHIQGKGPLIIVFKSDESDNMKGFKLNFEFELDGPDPCESNPCQQSGTCQTFSGYYKCECPDGYAGVNCEIDKDECASYPCQNGGQCVDGMNSFTCNCTNQFTGDLCEIEPDPCVSDPCVNGGLCVNRVVDFVCSCPRDFMGDTCEEPIPTPSPQPDSSSITSPNPQEGNKDDTESMEPSPNDNDDAGEPSNTDEPSHGSTSNHNGALIAAIVIILLLALLLAAIGLWYWCKRKRKKDGQKLNKEVTLINMKTKSEHGVGKEGGRRHSRTTSINSVSVKANAKGSHDELLDKLKKMSEDIIMEEVTDETNKGTKPVKQMADGVHYYAGNPPSVPERSSVANQLLALQSPNQQEIESPVLKRMSVPLTQRELEHPGQSLFNDTYDYASPVKGNLFPYPKVTPDAAVYLLNQIKQNDQPSFDFKSAMSQYAPGDYSKVGYNPNSIPNHSIPNGKISAVSDVQQPHLTTSFPPEHFDLTNPKSSYFLPNVPQMPEPTNENLEVRSPAPNDLDQMLELSPEEAAEVVNHLLMSKPAQNRGVSSQEAMDIIRDVRDGLYAEGRSSITREKSIILQPGDAAKIMSTFRNQLPHADYDDFKNGNISLQSSRESVNQGNKHHPRLSKDFREYPTIQEEPTDADDNLKRKVKHANSKSDRKRQKRIPSGKTMDPREKVNDWLENSPKVEKGQKRSLASSVASGATETHTVVTRNMPAKNDHTPAHKQNPESGNSSETGNSPMVQRTIKQSRKMLPDNKRLLPITENKAKSLVEKLIRAPARSSQSVVGPGLSVERENAFLGDGRTSGMF